MADSRTCTAEGCDEPRAVFPSGVRPMCLDHIRERQRAASRRWQEAHPGRKEELERRWREANPEQSAEIARRWREANPDHAYELGRRWRLAHPERVRQYETRWRDANQERVHEKRRRRYQANREQSNELAKRWAAAHPERVREAARRKRERNAGLSGRYVRIDAILALDLRCGMPILSGDETQMGHEPPIAWLRQHPDYDGPCIVVPQHQACNHRDSMTPYWLLDWKGA